MVQEGWIAQIPAALEFLDPPWHSIVEGLLLPRPQYRITEEENSLEDYRDFRYQRDIQRTAQALDMITYQGHLLCDHLGLNAQIIDDIRQAYVSWSHTHRLTWSAVFLTALSGHLLDHSYVLAPLYPDDVRNLLQIVRDHGNTSGLDSGLKERILHDLYRRTHPLTERESHLLGIFVDYAWNRLEEEIGQLDSQASIDPRFISALVIAEKKA
jgi:hypothetical protein